MSAYEIIPIQTGRRVLVINSYFDLEKRDELHADDFDIVLFNMPQVSYNSLRKLLADFSPVTSTKYQLKPKFLVRAQTMPATKLEPLFDGFVVSATDTDLAVRAEEIITLTQQLNIPAMKTPAFNEREFFIRLSQYALCRGENNFTSSSCGVYSMGVSAFYAAAIDIHDASSVGQSPDDTNLRSFTDFMLENQYVEPVRFVDRIHLCPFCNNEALLFTECCTQCNSSNIDEEDMIHHFRCANITPESTYRFDGVLRCPKCKRILRHIGVDYDRPAKVAVCNECHTTLFRTTMRILCRTCGKMSSPDTLIPYNVQEFAFTEAGRYFICNYQI